MHTLQRELRKRRGIFDPHTALAALESVVDISRDYGDAAAPRYNTIYKQCRPLLHNPQFQNILLKLLGDKQDVEVAKIIEKTLRQKQSPWQSNCLPAGPPAWSPSARLPPFHPYFSGRSQMRCFNCNALGHFARACPSRPRRRTRGNIGASPYG